MAYPVGCVRPGDLRAKSLVSQGARPEDGQRIAVNNPKYMCWLRSNIKAQNNPWSFIYVSLPLVFKVRILFK